MRTTVAQGALCGGSCLSAVDAVAAGEVTPPDGGERAAGGRIGGDAPAAPQPGRVRVCKGGSVQLGAAAVWPARECSAAHVAGLESLSLTFAMRWTN